MVGGVEAKGKAGSGTVVVHYVEVCGIGAGAEW